MEVDRGGQGPHRVVRRDADVVGFGASVDFAHFEQAATYADVGLDDICALVGHQIEELETPVEALARG